MVSHNDVRAVTQNLIAWIISLVIGAVVISIWPWLGELGAPVKLAIEMKTAQAISLAVLLIVILGAFIWSLSSAHMRAQTFVDREESIARSVALVRRYCRTQHDEFFSTRVTHWDHDEASIARTEFRSLITEKVMAGGLVKRLWHVKDLADMERMEFYLQQYRSYDNYNLRVFSTLPVNLPEIICVDGRGASIAFPETRSPRRMTLIIQFHKKREVDAIRKYFDLLWQQAIPIKEGSLVQNGALESLRLQLKSQR